MDKYKIVDRRLEVAVSFGRRGARVADIGTDHASLPIYLVGNGIAPCALACDINEGPLRAAKLNIASAGLSDSIGTYLTDGLNGIEDYDPEDVYILGMGGELISRIVLSSALSRKAGVRLILQPMTHVELVREYLQNGFYTVAENVVCEDGKIYQVLCLQYDGEFHALTREELELGKLNIEKRSEEFLKLLYSTIAKHQKRIDGIKLGGGDASELEEYVKGLRGMYEN